MITKDIDILLQQSLSREISPPQELEKITLQKMNVVTRKKSGWFATFLNMVCFIFLALETIVILSCLNFTVLKIMFIYFMMSSIFMLLIFQIVTKNINLKKIL